MLDREKYEKEMSEARADSIRMIGKFLAENADKIGNIRNLNLSGDWDEATMKKVEAIPIKAEGRNPDEVAEELIENVLEKAMVLQHPRFFSFVCCSVSPYSLIGSMLTSIYNLNACGSELAPEANLIEEKLLRWMGERAGYSDPDKVSGIFTSGGSLSNLTGLIAGRTNKLGNEHIAEGVAYLTDQSHSSIRKGMRMMGLREDQVCILPCDDEYKMNVKLLREAVARDKAAGKKPFLVVGSLGTTNTGSIDPFDEIAEVCKEYDMWFHVDGAFGGSILQSDIYRNYAKGIEKADSFSWDFHKWSSQTYSCSALVVKDKQTLLDAFVEHPEYLEDVRSEDHLDGWDRGIEMSRPARCLKLWYTLQVMGTDAIADIIDYSFFNAKTAEKKLLEDPYWKMYSPLSCATLCFRYEPETVDPAKYNDLTAEISNRLNEDGFANIFTTVLKGHRVLRICAINGNTTTEDIVSSIEVLTKIAKETTKDFE